MSEISCQNQSEIHPNPLTSLCFVLEPTHRRRVLFCFCVGKTQFLARQLFGCFFLLKLPRFTWEPRKCFLPLFAGQVEMTLDPAQSGDLDSREGQGLFSRWY